MHSLITICLLYFFVFTESVLGEAEISYTSTCNNGEKIKAEDVCDGKKDCADGSDETVRSCLHINCPSFAFQCTYGACVNGNAPCDGIQDCIDGSDETSTGCQENVEIRGNCTREHFQCKTSGECIQAYSACDGKQDCVDGTDETVDLCTPFYCPSFAFRCGYGACVSGNSKCDGIIDCLDASDESLKQCGKEHVLSTEKPTITINEITTTTEKNIYLPKKGCIVGYTPRMKYFLATEDNRELQSGQYVDEYQTIIYKCHPKYILDNHNTSLCLNGKWTNESSKCIKYCSYIPITGITFKAKCEYNGRTISCYDKLSPGTKATLSCQEGYIKPNRPVHDVLTCDDNGEWNYSPYRCIKLCGTEAKHPRTNESLNNMVPWNVAIYSSISGPYKHICGGTIINAKIILSAAHCFYDDKDEVMIPKEYFMVGTGKLFKNIDAIEPFPTQFFNISEIYIPLDYKGINLFYQTDISILVLNNFIQFNSYIKPICTKWNKGRAPSQNKLGIIAGWGKVSNSSNQLRILEVSSLKHMKCVMKTNVKHRNLITSDKFCVDSSNGESLCNEDSGAAFASWKIIDNIKTFFLKGVVSNGLTDSKNCSGEYCTLLTNVKLYRDIINDYESQYRPK